MSTTFNLTIVYDSRNLVFEFIFFSFIWMLWNKQSSRRTISYYLYSEIQITIGSGDGVPALALMYFNRKRMQYDLVQVAFFFMLCYSHHHMKNCILALDANKATFNGIPIHMQFDKLVYVHILCVSCFFFFFCRCKSNRWTLECIRNKQTKITLLSSLNCVMKLKYVHFIWLLPTLIQSKTI